VGKEAAASHSLPVVFDAQWILPDQVVREFGDDLLGSFDLAVSESARVLAVVGRVVPSTTDLVELRPPDQLFLQREEIDLAAYAGRTVPMDLVLGRERTQRTKVVKQADVTMLQYPWGRSMPRRLALGDLPDEDPGPSPAVTVDTVSPAVAAMLHARVTRAGTR